MNDLSSQLNPSGCQKTFNNLICGISYDSSFKPCNILYCPICSAKKLATAKALYNEKKKTLEFLDSNPIHLPNTLVQKKIEELKSEINQIEQEVPEVKQ